MGRLMVITTPDLETGFRLAGVETFGVKSADEAERVLRGFLEGEEASLIVVRQDLLQDMSPRLQRQTEMSYSPVVMSIPGGTPAAMRGTRRQHIAELIRRAIGFHIVFDAEQPANE